MPRGRFVALVQTILLVAPALAFLTLSAASPRPGLPRLAPVLALIALGAWVIWLRWTERPGRERWMIGVALLTAALATGVAGVRELRQFAESGRADSPVQLAAGYDAFWKELEARAESAGAAFGSETAALGEPARAFELLERSATGSRLRGLTLLLLSADGEVVAWSGRGMLREPSGESLAAGRFARESHASASAWVVRALPQPAASGGAAWIVAGESRALSAAAPLLGLPLVERQRAWRYGDEVEGAGWIALETATAPRLLLGPRTPVSAVDGESLGAMGLASLAVGLGLLGLVALRGLALGVLSGTVLRARAGIGELAVLLGAAVIGIGSGFGVGAGLVAGVAAALGATVPAIRRFVTSAGPRRPTPLLDLLAKLLPIGAATGIAALSFDAPSRWPDLAESPAFLPSAAALRLAVAAILFCALSFGRALTNPSRRSGAPLAAALTLLALAASIHDRGAVALPVLLLSLLFAVFGVERSRLRPAASALAMALVALLGSAIAWQWGARERLARQLPELLAPLAPPPAELLATTERRLERHFHAFDLALVAPESGAELDPYDLAYSLWRESPLARVDTASALVVEPFDGVASSFSFGFPLDELERPDHSPARWDAAAPSAWRALERRGEGALVDGGREQGRIRWYFAPLPGFGVRDAAIRDLPTTLLGAKRSSELSAARALALPVDSGVAVVIFGPGGEIELSPWSEGTPSLDFLRSRVASGAALADTPAGSARFTLREAPGATLALLAPRLGPGVALERIGNQFAGTLFVLSLVLALGALLAMPRATARDVATKTLRSYAKRLILVYSILLLVPLALLYALLSEALGQRVLREQRLAAQAALTSAQRVLGEYVLSLEPGFGLDTALDDDLLVWLSRVVGHEIHLYWNGVVYASSQPELFAAGFLPRRVPGEIWRGAAYGGELLMTRTTRAGEARYVELYAPLVVPGVDPRASRLLLSMPLLAQQEEAVVETARIRRRTLLATLGAFLLLAAIGVRLARSFTRPILDLVAGTKRIAGGAPALGVSPKVDELSALAEAIDQMARRISEGRAQLMREKQLVEGIVDSVTSGVVGVDRSGRILLANRVARQLLDVEPGERLLERLDLQPELAGLRRFVAASAGGAESATARAVLTSREDRDWSLIWVPLAGAEEAGGLLVVEDVSEVLRAQRLEAWAEMARLIAHEIKNPLTPIRLSTEHLRDVWERDRAHFETVFDRCTSNILVQVDELREIASEFSIYSHIPKSERIPGDLAPMLHEIVGGYAAAPPPGVVVEFELEQPSLPARIDAKLLGRAVRNLLENAIRASTTSERRGGVVRVEAGEDARAGSVWIRVSDEGPGVPETQLARIFEPYFSTHSGGTGLGLPIALRIAEEHDGGIRAVNRATGGLEVTITIPRE